MLYLPDNERGALPLIILIAAISLLVLLLLTNLFSFKDALLSSLYPKPSSQAAGVVELSINPSIVSSSPNSTFTINLDIDSKGASISAAQLEINFDATKLQAQSIQAGTFLPVIFKAGAVATNSASITLGSNPDQPKIGVGTLATVSFKALANTTTPIQISYNTSKTQIAAVGQTGNVVGLLNTSSVTIAPLATTTPQPTPTPNPPSANFIVVITPTSITSGNTFRVQLFTRSDADFANLFTAKLAFPADKLEITGIDTTNSLVDEQYWVERFFDNVNGKIALTGAVPNPGYKTSGSNALLASIDFTTKSQGDAQVIFEPASAIYRNSDNLNILANTTNDSITINPGPTLTPVPTPTPEPIACSITSASWNSASNPVDFGTNVGLDVQTTGDCAGEQISFEVWEDDGILGADNVNTQPAIATLSGNSASTSWISEYQSDGLFSVGGNPEYYFMATLVNGTSSVKSADPLLEVSSTASGGCIIDGDLNTDCAVDLVDLSVLLSNFGNSGDYLQTTDLNDDGVVNSFDYSTLLNILESKGIINRNVQ